MFFNWKFFLNSSIFRSMFLKFRQKIDQISRHLGYSNWKIQNHKNCWILAMAENKIHKIQKKSLDQCKIHQAGPDRSPFYRFFTDFQFFYAKLFNFKLPINQIILRVCPPNFLARSSTWWMITTRSKAWFLSPNKCTTWSSRICRQNANRNRWGMGEGCCSMQMQTKVMIFWKFVAEYCGNNW